MRVGLDRLARDEREEEEPLGSVADREKVLARSIGCGFDLCEKDETVELVSNWAKDIHGVDTHWGTARRRS